MNISKLIYNILIDHKVKDVFMYSGGAILPLINEFYKGSINYYVNSHEQNCGHAATGYAKTSGRTGVSIVTSGPGVTNSITPLLDANNDSTPFVLLSGNVSLQNMGTNAFQEAPSVDITTPVTKWSYCIKDPNEVNDIIYEAFKVANTGKKGSVHIDIPKCILVSNTNNFEKKEIYELDNDIISSLPISEIANMILMAERPILYVGQGANKAYNSVRELAVRYNIPITTTLHAMGVFDENHELSLKMCGMHGHAAANYALQDSDCIIAIGSRFDDRTTGNIKKYAPKCKQFIHLNIEKSEINKVVSSEYIIGKCENTIPKLLIELNKTEHPNNNTNWIKKIKKWKKDYPYQYKKNKMKTQDVLIEINKYVKANNDNFIFTGGVGNHQMMSTQYINWKYPGRYISSGSLGVMGTGLPYAIGAQIANPNKIIIDIDGDSSFNMTSTDMKTIVEHDLPIKILILNNETQDMVRVWENLFFEKRITATTNKRNPCYKSLAESYGITSLKCNFIDDLESSIHNFIHYNNGPILLECKVEPDMCLPLVAPGAGLDEMILFDKDYTILKNECPS